MRHVSLYAVLALLLCAFVSPSPSRADGVDDFTLSDGLGNTITWQLPASPTNFQFANPGFEFDIQNVPATVDGIAGDIFLQFENGGGLRATIDGVTPVPGALVSIGTGLFASANAAQVYFGPENAPTFLTGIFSSSALTENIVILPVGPFEIGTSTTATLTITPDATSVPEPSTLGLISAGLLGMGAMLLGKLR